MAAGDLSGLVTGASQNLHDLYLQGLVQSSPRHLVQYALMVRLDQVGDLPDGVFESVVYLCGRLGGDVLVVDASSESLRHDGTHCQLGDVIEEEPRCVGAVVAGDLIQYLSLEGADSLLVYGPLEQGPVADLDERIELTVLLLAGGTVLADGRLKGHPQIFRKD